MGLDFLNRICRVIHTDLKPENVLICLTEQELRKIVEDEQLASSGDYTNRLNYYCERYHLGPVQQNKPATKRSKKVVKEEEEDDEMSSMSEILSTLDSRIEEIKEKIEVTDSHNYKRTLKKKLKKA